MSSASNLSSHSQLHGTGRGKSVGSSAKIGLVGVLALIVLVVALWDKSEDPAPGQPQAASANPDLVGTVANLPGTDASLPLDEEVEGAPVSSQGRPVAGPVATAPLASGGTAPAAVSPAAPSAVAPLAAAPTAAPSAATPATTKPAATGSTKPVSGKTYTTQIGDNWWKVAEKFYGDGSQWKVIADANGLGDTLPHSRTIVIPDLGGASKATATTPTTATTSSTGSFDTYEVVSGDSLWKIAEKKLGKGDRWKELRDLNADVLGKNDAVRVGMKLKVPVK